MTLLKNEKNVLPFSRDDFDAAASMAVVGPLADDWRVLVGAANYAYPQGPSLGVVTVLAGLRNALPAGATTHTDGCVDTACASADITGAVAVAVKAKATVLVLGDQFGGKRTGWPLCQGSTTNGCESESHDRTTIEIPGKQADVVRFGLLIGWDLSVTPAHIPH